MHFPLLSLLVCALLVPSLACSKVKSERCQDICQKETDCAEQRGRDGETYPYDLDECIDACVGLERDSNNRKKVDNHKKCADKAGDSCEALLECRF
ncbi:MAG: hypothetical protein GY811_00655 [Myxococcales bacterium]|nr:hypothetical protein [Myxococcales bacterium]